MANTKVTMECHEGKTLPNLAFSSTSLFFDKILVVEKKKGKRVLVERDGVKSGFTLGNKESSKWFDDQANVKKGYLTLPTSLAANLMEKLGVM